MAQLDNAADSDSEDRGFESLRAGQEISRLIETGNFFFKKGFEGRAGQSNSPVDCCDRERPSARSECFTETVRSLLHVLPTANASLPCRRRRPLRLNCRFVIIKSTIFLTLSTTRQSSVAPRQLLSKGAYNYKRAVGMTVCGCSKLAPRCLL